jgi:predicted dehydrogenase
MKNLRFGIIGAGNIAAVHAAAIHGTSDAELVAIAARGEERGRVFAQKHNAAWHADYRELLRRDDIDAVSLAVPHDLHAPMAIDAAKAGKHVLIEKPMAINVAECDAMMEACERANVTLGVVFQMRFEPLAVKLKQALDANTLGQLLWVSTNMIWNRTEAYYHSAPWRGTWAHEGGGVLINQAVHLIDLLIWFSGMPNRVTAKMRTLNHQIEVEDGAMAILEYADKRLGLIQATTAAFPGYPERLEFYGTNGSVVYHKGKAELEWHLVEPREDRTDTAQVSSGAANPMDITAAAHTTQFQDFANAVREHRKPFVDGLEGRKSVELIQAIYRSARANEAINLPFSS